MPTPKAPGRMIRRDISRSKGFASLSSKAATLFCLLLPHFDSHGKLNGEPNFVKGEVCPLVPYLDLPTIKKSLMEITDKTNVKWFRASDGCWYLHALNFHGHQDIRLDRLGPDRLPSSPESASFGVAGPVQEQSRTSPGVVPPEVEVELEVQGEEEGEVEVKQKGKAKGKGRIADAPSPPLEGGGGAAPKDDSNTNGQSVGEGNGADLPDTVVADINRLPEGARTTLLITLSDFRQGTASREEAVDTAVRLRVPKQSIDTLFPVEATG